MMETMLMSPVTNVALGIFVLLLIFIGAIVFSGNMQDAPESPKIEKVKLKIISITYNQGEDLYLVQLEDIGSKIIPKQRNLEIEYINKEKEMCLEMTQSTPIYVQKRCLRKDKIWMGIPTTTYKLYVVKEKISTVCRKRLYCTLQ